MKSKEMFRELLEAFGSTAFSEGIKDRTIALLRSDLTNRFDSGAASRDNEVAELKEVVDQLTNDVRNLVDERHALEQKLREKQLASFNSGVECGRSEAVTQAAVAAIKSVVERTVIAATVLGAR